ncbi:hypothetical protein PGT21_017445 [Puccinia graminis f. sp. tritici]|uniref:Uncharacterized protein n=1 Tax=Puccinia graminis f. sp. tritici TaxID=56615 RepID=A0A5B0PS34_PUCGR|nr:hypothetical protein PGT21_017445 [Puccinia graminis f. sp. tritici]
MKKTVINEVASSAKKAFDELQSIDDRNKKTEGLERLKRALVERKEEILRANDLDVQAAEGLVKEGKLSESIVNRLNLRSSSDKFDSIVDGIEAVIKLEDPTGKIQSVTKLDEGLELYKVSWNAAILKGGKESNKTQEVLTRIINEALSSCLPANLIQTVSSRSDYQRATRTESNHTKIPVLGHADGLCNIYIDQDADPQKVIRCVLDAKTTYPAACNSVETLLVHRSWLGDSFTELVLSLLNEKVTLKLDQASLDVLKSSGKGDEPSAVLVELFTVDDLTAAIEHINQYSSHHTDSILTESSSHGSRFCRAVNSASVYVNCSTRFADGFRYGFGTEIGISTSKIHSRGPVGLDGLVIYKWMMFGSGDRAHITADYGQGKPRQFLHSNVPVDQPGPSQPDCSSSRTVQPNQHTQSYTNLNTTILISTSSTPSTTTTTTTNFNLNQLTTEQYRNTILNAISIQELCQLISDHLAFKFLRNILELLPNPESRLIVVDSPHLQISSSNKSVDCSTALRSSSLSTSYIHLTLHPTSLLDHLINVYGLPVPMPSRQPVGTHYDVRLFGLLAELAGECEPYLEPIGGGKDGLQNVPLAPSIPSASIALKPATLKKNARIGRPSAHLAAIQIGLEALKLVPTPLGFTLHPLPVSKVLVKRTFKLFTGPINQSTPTSDTHQHQLTFNLALTDKQRAEREAVALPFLPRRAEDGTVIEAPGQMFDGSFQNFLPSSNINHHSNNTHNNPNNGAKSGMILYEPDSADDLDDEEPDDELLMRRGSAIVQLEIYHTFWTKKKSAQSIFNKEHPSS